MYVIDSYQDIYEELTMLKMEVADMEDEHLIDECLNIDGTIYTCDDAETIYSSFFHDCKLNNDERKRLVGFYILAYSSLCFEE
jgi:hypothetical protein